ncbi:hypothetical protein CANCADRAFT_83230 [Tortispora caseinolytica NRRL Y-17796]|uniref:Peptidase S9 prolyl oligopeptidase catalytic domain-containing protein n=1 Tax=Tortispora caseinolytica NRRL Y-17796 TaxID=767744 RepID=A0A1E4TK87_9ASCO|nr:hypothetical protein CANCADRAFT_83230 [Tortispora caseinolytica NRRL Y-17796]
MKKEAIDIAGTIVNVYEPDVLDDFVNVFFLLHGRTRSSRDMEEFCESICALSAKNICVTFDAAYHCTRQTDPTRVEDWKGGNKRHAFDMITCVEDSARLVSMFHDYIDMRFTVNKSHIKHYVMGISLGGHTAYSVLANDLRFDGIFVLIGCPSMGQLLESRIERESESVQEQLELFPKKEREYIRFKCDQKNLNMTMTDKFINIYHGDSDTLVPFYFTSEWLNSIDFQDKVQVNMFSGTGHSVPGVMKESLLSDIKQQLLL